MKDVLGGRDEPRNEKLNEKESCHVAVVAKEAAMNRSLILSPPCCNEYFRVNDLCHGRYQSLFSFTSSVSA